MAAARPPKNAGRSHGSARACGPIEAARQEAGSPKEKGTGNFSGCRIQTSLYPLNHSSSTYLQAKSGMRGEQAHTMAPHGNVSCFLSSCTSTRLDCAFIGHDAAARLMAMPATASNSNAKKRTCRDHAAFKRLLISVLVSCFPLNHSSIPYLQAKSGSCGEQAHTMPHGNVSCFFYLFASTSASTIVRS